MTLSESQDSSMRAAGPSGLKWKQNEAVKQAKSALQHADIVRHVQQGRGGLGLCKGRPWLNKTTPSERRKMVILEVQHQEEVVNNAKSPGPARTVEKLEEHREEEN